MTKYKYLIYKDRNFYDTMESCNNGRESNICEEIILLSESGVCLICEIDFPREKNKIVRRAHVLEHLSLHMKIELKLSDFFTNKTCKNCNETFKGNPRCMKLHILRGCEVKNSEITSKEGKHKLLRELIKIPFIAENYANFSTNLGPSKRIAKQRSFNRDWIITVQPNEAINPNEKSFDVTATYPDMNHKDNEVIGKDVVVMLLHTLYKLFEKKISYKSSLEDPSSVPPTCAHLVFEMHEEASSNESVYRYHNSYPIPKKFIFCHHQLNISPDSCKIKRLNIPNDNSYKQEVHTLSIQEPHTVKTRSTKNRKSTDNNDSNQPRKKRKIYIPDNEDKNSNEDTTNDADISDFSDDENENEYSDIDSLLFSSEDEDESENPKREPSSKPEKENTDNKTSTNELTKNSNKESEKTSNAMDNANCSDDKNENKSSETVIDITEDEDKYGNNSWITDSHVDYEQTKAEQNINMLLKKFTGKLDLKLASEIYNLVKDETDTHKLEQTIRSSNLIISGLTEKKYDEFIFELYDIITNTNYKWANAISSDEAHIEKQNNLDKFSIKKENIKVETKSNLDQCTKCQKYFPNENLLRDHMTTHDKKFKRLETKVMKLSKDFELLKQKQATAAVHNPVLQPYLHSYNPQFGYEAPCIPSQQYLHYSQQNLISYSAYDVNFYQYQMNTHIPSHPLWNLPYPPADFK